MSTPSTEPSRPWFARPVAAPLWAAVIAGLALAGVGVGVGAALGGNGSTTSAVSPATTATTDLPTEPTTAAPTTTEAPTTTLPTNLPFGQGADVVLNNIQNQTSPGKVTVFAYKVPVATSGPQPSAAGSPPDYVWSAADVQVCAPGSVTSPPPYISVTEFILSYADGTRIDFSHTGYDNFPQPRFPTGDTFLHAGECARGWITYAVPKAAKPIAVVWTRQEQQFKWAVP